MRIQTTQTQIHLCGESDDHKMTITLTVDPESADTVLQNADYLLNSKCLEVEIDRAFPQRSRNANAMFWALCEKLATAVGCSNDEMYFRLLERYGCANVVTVDEEIADSMEQVLKEQYKWILRLGVTEINKRKSVQFFCYRGSHTYNTKEMGRLIDGTISECKELGIPTDAPHLVKELVSQWGSEPESAETEMANKTGVV